MKKVLNKQHSSYTELQCARFNNFIQKSKHFLNNNQIIITYYIADRFQFIIELAKCSKNSKITRDYHKSLINNKIIIQILEVSLEKK